MVEGMRPATGKPFKGTTWEAGRRRHRALGAGNLTPREIQSFPSYSGKEGDPSIIERWPKQKGEAKAKKAKAIRSTQEKEHEGQWY